MSIFINYIVRSMIKKKKKDEIVPIFINNPLKKQIWKFSNLEKADHVVVSLPLLNPFSREIKQFREGLLEVKRREKIELINFLLFF
jgi:hypothetical protein